MNLPIVVLTSGTRGRLPKAAYCYEFVLTGSQGPGMIERSWSSRNLHRPQLYVERRTSTEITNDQTVLADILALNINRLEHHNGHH